MLEGIKIVIAHKSFKGLVPNDWTKLRQSIMTVTSFSKLTVSFLKITS